MRTEQQAIIKSYVDTKKYHLTQAIINLTGNATDISNSRFRSHTNG